MHRSIKDTSSLQVADYASLLWNINQGISESLTFGNHRAVPELVAHLNRMLSPYRDEKYYDEIKKLESIKPEKSNTAIGDSNNYRIYEIKRVNLLHEILLRLAYRKGFLPASKSGQSIDFDMRDMNE